HLCGSVRRVLCRRLRGVGGDSSTAGQPRQSSQDARGETHRTAGHGTARWAVETFNESPSHDYRPLLLRSGPRPDRATAVAAPVRFAASEKVSLTATIY